MEHASLVAFLEGAIAPEAFEAKIAAEVAACNEALRSGGRGYIIIGDGPSTVVTRDHAKRLLSAVASGRLSFECANYAAECIIMSDDFDFIDEAVRDAIFFVEDDSRPPTAEEVIAALQALDRDVG